MSSISEENLKELKKTFPQLKFKINFSLSRITYFQIGGEADALTKVTSRLQLIKLVDFCRQQDIKFLILGGASNVIVANEGFKGLVILTRHDELKAIDEKENFVTICADSGLQTAVLVRKIVDLGLTGLEVFTGVPGRLGGAIYNNSHYQQELIGNHVSRVEVVNTKGDVVWLDASDCEFSYDDSRFQRTNEPILRVEFTLPHGDKNVSAQLIKESTLYRIKTQPLGFPSSGCIFKNVPNTNRLRQLFPQYQNRPHISAGFLIDQAGLKGLSKGSVKVSEKHAAFLINTNGGKAEDVEYLINQIKIKVKEKFGVDLEEEVFWVN
jgi:UDP-N-acetylmuramate dehydrogenase